MAKKVSRFQKLREDALALLDERTLGSLAEFSNWQKFAHFWVMVWRSFARNRCPVHAYALSYTTLLALVPMLAVVLSLTSSMLKGESEERIGQVMATRRKEVTLATKLTARTADQGRRQIELSLKRLRTDHLDVLHIHELKNAEDLAAIEARGGVLEALHEAREQKTARAIGITCHADPAALRTALERHDFDCAQMALNAGLARMANAPGGMKATPMGASSFERLALPVATRKHIGVIAMKVFGQEQLLGAAPVEKLLSYALSLPVSLASVGMPRLEHIERNAVLARAFTPMPARQRRQLEESIESGRKLAMHQFFSAHQDG